MEQISGKTGYRNTQENIAGKLPVENKPPDA